MALSAADIAELRTQLLKHAEATFGVRRTATLIADRITLVRSNAAKAHDDLARIAAEALAKDGADAAAIETDRARLYAELDEKEALKVSKLEAEAVVIDKALEELCSIGEAAREQFVASGGEVPAEGWDAAGEAAWRKTDAEAAAERQALELEIERLTKSSTSAPPVDRAGGAAVAGKA